MKKTAKLTIETERIFVIRRPRAQRRARCEICDEVVSLVTADEAAALARTSTRAIYRFIEARKLHFIEPVEGSLLICLNSLGERCLRTGADSLMGDLARKGEDDENHP